MPLQRQAGSHQHISYAVNRIPARGSFLIELTRFTDRGLQRHSFGREDVPNLVI